MSQWNYLPNSVNIVLSCHYATTMVHALGPFLISSGFVWLAFNEFFILKI